MKLGRLTFSLTRERRWWANVLNLCVLFLVVACNSSSNIDSGFNPGVSGSSGGTPPTISTLYNFTSQVGCTASISITFDEGTDDTEVLTATATSSNAALIPNSAITLEFTDTASDAAMSTATLTLKPLAAQAGASTITVTVTDDSGNSANSTFTFTVTNSLSGISGMQLWLKADGGAFSDAGATLAGDGVAVQEWHDQSGNTRNASQTATPANRPLWIQDAINGKPAIRFDGANDAMTTMNFGLVQPQHIFMVAEQLTQGAGNCGRFFDGHVIDSMVAYHPGGNGIGIYNGLPINDGTYGLNTYHIVNALFDDDESFIFTDGVRRAFGDINNTGNAGGLTLGATGLQTSCWGNVEIAELIVFNRELTQSEQHKIEAYLSYKYDIDTIPTASLTLWLKGESGVRSDACAGTKATGGDTVSCWEDQSGNGFNVASPTGSVSWSAGNNSLNGRPSVLFGGDAKLESGTPANWSFLHDGSDHSNFVIARTTSTDPGSFQVLFDTSRCTGNNTGFCLYLEDTAGGGHNDAVELTAMSTSNNPYLNTSPNGSAVSGSWNMITHLFDSSGHSNLSTNGTLVSQASASSNYDPGDPFGALSIGAYTNGAASGPFSGDIAELMLFDAELSASKKQFVEHYLAAKYNLTTASHTVLAQPDLRLWLRADQGVGLDRGFAAEFTKANAEYLSTGDHANLSFTGDVTVCAWIYWNSNTGEENIVAKWDEGSSNREYRIYYRQNPINRFTFEVSNDGTAVARVQADSLGFPETRRWYFVCGWHSAGSQDLGIRVDQLTTNLASHTTGILNGTADFNIGAKGNGTGTFPFGGRVANVAVWDTTFSTASLTELYNHGSGFSFNEIPFHFDTASLMAYYDLDEAGAGRADDNGTAAIVLADNNTVTQAEGPRRKVSFWRDQSAHGNHAAQLVPARKPIWLPSGGTPANNRPVIRFNDRLNTSMEAADHATLEPQQLTLFVVANVFNLNVSDSWEFLAGKAPSSWAAGYGITDLTGVGVIEEGFFAQTWNGNFVKVATPLNQMRLHTGTFDAVNVNYRLNGVSQGDDPFAGPITYAVESFYIGGIGTQYNTDGDILEIILYGQALTASERDNVECYLSDKYNLGIGGC